jgi:CheY-like chemotaxis protein
MTPDTSRILVVDDSAALRENLQECLELEGYQVTAATDGPNALEALATGPLPDVVLLDLVMPGMDGRELVARIRADPRFAGVRIVMSSGHTATRMREGIAFDAFLPKPFGVDELLAVLRRATIR